MARVWYTGTLIKGEAGGAIAPPHFGRIEGAAGRGGAPHYYLPPQFEEAIKVPVKTSVHFYFAHPLGSITL